MGAQDIGERVYWLRDERGWTQEELARAAGVSPTTVSHIESGTIRRPRINTIRRLARAFGLSTDELSTPKVTPPSAQPSEEAGGGKSAVEQRINDLRLYKTWLQDLAVKLSGELQELQETRDQKALQTLLMNAIWVSVGVAKDIEEDKDIEEPEDETLEELEARGEMWEAYGELSNLLKDIGQTIDALEGIPGNLPSDVPFIPDRIRRKAG